MRRIMIAAVAAFGLIAGFGVANAATDAPATRHLSISKVDFSNPQTVKTLHERMRRAAREACNSGYLIATQLVDADRTCTEQTLADAVAKVDRPLLTAMQQQCQQTLTARGY